MSAISQHLFSQEPNVWNRLDNLFVKGKAGGTPISTNKEYYNGNIPFLSINDITRQGKYIWLTEKAYKPERIGEFFCLDSSKAQFDYVNVCFGGLGHHKSSSHSYESSNVLNATERQVSIGLSILLLILF